MTIQKDIGIQSRRNGIYI